MNNITNSELFDDIQCVVLCGGKCGSSTLAKTLEHAGFNTTRRHQFQYLPIELQQKIINNTSSEKIFIFDSYRTPIERHISAFFQSNCFIIKNVNTVNMNMLNYWFNKYHLDCDNYHPLDELAIFNENEFDFQKEYIEKCINNIHYVKLRFKSITVWNNILSKFFNKTITLENDNLPYDKEYYDAYMKFKKEYMVPIEYLDTIKSYPTFQKYNALLEKNEYIEYWMTKSCNNDDFLNKIDNTWFQNATDDFNATNYKLLNPELANYSDIDAKIHYELIGHYQKLKVIDDFYFGKCVPNLSYDSE